MTIFTCDIKKFKFSVADTEQVRKDFIRDSRLIFINGKSLMEIYKEMNLTVKKEGDLKEENLSAIFNKYCFTDAKEKLLPCWQEFANALFHQGGLLYAFEAALKETMSMPGKNGKGKVYIPKEIEKEVHISFDKQCLTIQEKCKFTEIADPEDENNLVAKKGNYLIKAELLHHVSLIKKNGEKIFQHEIKQPEFKCKNSDLQKCLNQKRLSIMQALKNFISKIFRIPCVPNRSSFFQNSYHQGEIGLDKITKKEGNNNILVIDWKTITPTNRR